MNEFKINLKEGEVVLRKPKAKQRNNAMIQAETSDGFKKSIFYTKLLPSCIASHPWGIRKINESLDALEYDEYDLLIDKMEEMMNPETIEDKKKRLQNALDQLNNLEKMENQEVQ